MHFTQGSEGIRQLTTNNAYHDDKKLTFLQIKIIKIWKLQKSTNQLRFNEYA